MASTPSSARQVLDAWSQSVCQKDIEALMALYSPNIFYFDVVPPLCLEGLDAVRRNFIRWFDMWNGPIGVEIPVRCAFARAANSPPHTCSTVRAGA